MYRDYYLGFANSVLWPVFHNRLDLASFDNGYYDAYRRVNARFADSIAPQVRPTDTIWVHDYHLIPLGAELRKRGIDNPIGFFLHIPFPPADVMPSISQHEELGHSLAAYDLVGLQTMKDTSAFLDYVQRQLGGRILNDARVRLGDGTLMCGSFPVGIDTEDFARAAQQAGHRRDDRSAFPARLDLCHVIGVDRLDYSKGLLQRFEAFGKFLQSNPHRLGHVSFIQIAPPTRQGLTPYKDMENELARLSGSINGLYGNLDWTPIRYINRALPRQRLAGLYRGARVGLVTPIQDGMNLVAKEYVAAQDPADPGVLVLSKFAGAAEELHDALIVNPYDVDDMAAAIETALRMPLDERVRRHKHMYERVRKGDIHNWGRTFIKQMEACAQRRIKEGLRYGPPSMNVLDEKPKAGRNANGGQTRVNRTDLRSYRFQPGGVTGPSVGK
jgi:trehalose 6-phosphate synthase